MAELTILQAEKRTGVHKDTIRGYIKSGRINATLRPNGRAGTYLIEETELAKLPKPYKKHGEASKSEVPQGTYPTITALPRMLTVAWGTPEEIVAYERLRLQLATA